jgi:carbamoyl-phosphate synthase large subunit
MGIDADFGEAFAKAESAGGAELPVRGGVFISVRNKDKRGMIFPAKRLAELGLDVYATVGTAEVLRRNGVNAIEVAKIHEDKPDVLDLMAEGKIDLIVNTPMGRQYRADGYYIRTAAVAHGIPCITTLSGAQAAVQGIEAAIGRRLRVKPLQEYHKELNGEGRAEGVSPERGKGLR